MDIVIARGAMILFLFSCRVRQKWKISRKSYDNAMKFLSYVAVHVFQDEGSYNLEYYLNEI